MAPVNFPDFKGKLHVQMREDFIGPGANCQAHLPCPDFAPLGCRHDYLHAVTIQSNTA